MGFQQGLSGLNTSSKSLEVIGNNVANANTYGAKAARAEFADMYAASLGGGGNNNIGIGARIAAVAQQFTQGNITTTNNNLDLAINGRGFFKLLTPQGENVYSRNGQFKRDAAGYIINNSGHQLLGQALDTKGVETGPPGVPIQLQNSSSPPQAATAITLNANLDAKATAKPASPSIDMSDASTYNFVTSQTVYGDKGAPVTVNYYFRKEADADPTASPATQSQWKVYASVDGSDNAHALNDSSGNMWSMDVQFTSKGLVDTATTPASTTLPDILSTKSGQNISGVTLDMSGMTEYSGSFAVTDLSGGGYAAGNLSDFIIENDGTVKARYTNGQSLSIARVMLADFKNLNGLQPVGNNEWKSTNASGDPLPLGAPGSGVYGLLQAGALEESNVDLTGELVNMIVAQRTYQANAQTIKAEDQVLQTLVNLR